MLCHVRDYRVVATGKLVCSVENGVVKARSCCDDGGCQVDKRLWGVMQVMHLLLVTDASFARDQSISAWKMLKGVR